MRKILAVTAALFTFSTPASAQTPAQPADKSTEVKSQALSTSQEAIIAFFRCSQYAYDYDGVSQVPLMKADDCQKQIWLSTFPQHQTTVEDWFNYKRNLIVDMQYGRITAADVKRDSRKADDQFVRMLSTPPAPPVGQEKAAEAPSGSGVFTLE